MKAEKQIKAVFEANKNAEKVFVTEDGQIFLTEAFAKAHSVKDGGKKRPEQLKITTILRADFFAKENSKSDNTGKGEGDGDTKTSEPDKENSKSDNMGKGEGDGDTKTSEPDKENSKKSKNNKNSK